MVKGGDGNISPDYTYRIQPHAKYEGLFPARTVDGVIESREAVQATLRDPGYTRDLELVQAQIKLEMKADGSLRGYVGGYRPWKPVYDGWVNARGPVIESLTWVELPAVYYALRRNADYSPQGENGEKTHICAARLRGDTGCVGTGHQGDLLQTCCTAIASRDRGHDWSLADCGWSCY